MKKEGNPISIGKASKKYGVPKMTLSRYAMQGKVETLVMPGTKGQARMLDELSVYRLVSDRLSVRSEKKVRSKGAVAESVVYRRGEGVAIDAMDTAREYMRGCKNRGYSKSSYVAAERIVMGFAERFDDLPFSGALVQTYINDMEVSQSSKKMYFGLLRAFYNWVESMYDIPTPIKRGMAPKVKRQVPRALDKSEVAKLLSVIVGRQDMIIVNTFLATAIRCGELCSLDKQDVYPGYIHIKAEEGCKTGEANVPIPEWLYKQLMSLRDDDGFLFADNTGKRITANALSSRILDYMDKAGIKGRHRGPHTLRHTAACNMLEATGDLDFVRQILRHKDMNMTLIYAQLRPKSVEDKYQSIMGAAINGSSDNFQFAQV